MERITQHLLDDLLQRFLKECKKCGLSVERKFANHYIQLLAYDCRDGLDVEGPVLGSCKIQAFIDKALQKYANPNDATVSNLKLTNFFRNCKAIAVDDFVKTFEENFNVKLRQLTDDILRYPETSNKAQIEEMFFKMQVFVVACYNIGSPKNEVLLNLTRQSLKSILGPSDLHKYVLTKRYHRLEYLERLSATVAGIIIYNNQAPYGDKENFRQIFDDLEMAQLNTRDNLDRRISEMEELKTKGSELMASVIEIIVPERKVVCHLPIERVRDVNRYVILFTVYARILNDLKESFGRTAFLTRQAAKKMDCVVNKINDLLKGRSAVESEVVFPHFVFLSGVWQSAISYLNHFAELNKIKEQMDDFVSPELVAAFADTLQQTANKNAAATLIKDLQFGDIIEKTKGRRSDLKLPNVAHIMDYCSMTIAFTNGLLVPATLHRQLCENLKLKFGFNNIEYVKYAQRYFEDFLDTFRYVIFSSTDLISLFQLEDHILKYYENMRHEKPQKSSSCGTQTEMVVTNDLSVRNRINVTWNAWDFHRETIHLAEIRKRQTHSTQTVLTYGQRTAQNQTYNARSHK